MDINVKLGNDIINDVSVIELKDADNPNKNIFFVPVTKVEKGKLYVHFKIWQDSFEGDGTRKIRFRPIILTMSSWASGAGWQYVSNYTEIGEWKTYALTTVGADELTDDFAVDIDVNNLPDTPTGYTGFGVLVDLTNSKFDYMTIKFYPNRNDSYAQSIKDTDYPNGGVLNGYSVSTNGSGYGQVCMNDAASTNSDQTLRIYKQDSCFYSGTQKTEIPKWSMVMYINCTGGED